MLDHAYAPSTWLPYLALAFDFAKAAVWPFVVVFAVASFRKQLLDLINRVWAMKVGVVSVKFYAEKERQIAKTDPSPEVSESIVRKLPKTPAIADGEKRVLVQLKDFPTQDHQALLVNAVAVLQLEKHFALVYANIFGSQIRALQSLNERGGIVGIDEGIAFFGEVKNRFPELQDWTFDRYVAFLRSNLLISVDDTTVSLTDVGRDFIQFVVRYGLSTEKHL